MSEARKTRSLSGSRSSSLFVDNTPGERHAARGPGLRVCRQGKKGRKTYSIYSGGQKKRVGGKLGRRKRPGPRDGSGTQQQQSPPTIVVQQCADSVEVEDNCEEEVTPPKKGLCLLKLSEVIGHPEGKNKASKRKVGSQAAQAVTKKKSKPMSHIRAKWLLGLSLTMVISSPLIPPPLSNPPFCAESECNEPRPAAAAGPHKKAKSPGAGGRGEASSVQEDVRIAGGEGGQDQCGLGEGAA